MSPAPASLSVLLLHGPNLALLGTREPDVYGSVTLAEIEAHFEARLDSVARESGVAAACTALSSDSEGDLVGWCGGARGVHDAIVINPGALTHYSWALHDALRAFGGIVIEVHLSNPQSREPFRHGSVVASVSRGSISGMGIAGYGLAARAVLEHAVAR
jgi:3-dehydroquinate dehydratase-2